jgi:hypothetical protein
MLPRDHVFFQILMNHRKCNLIEEVTKKGAYLLIIVNIKLIGKNLMWTTQGEIGYICKLKRFGDCQTTEDKGLQMNTFT